MAVTIQIGSDKTTNITGYSVTEDATPIDASDSSGGVGQINISLSEGDDVTTQLYLNDLLDLEDGSNGTTQGVVNSVQIANGLASIAGDSRIGALLADRTAAPFNGVLSDAFAYYLGLAGITTNYATETSIASTAVVFPGFTGNLWDYMKKMCVAMGAEISLVSDNIILRAIRGRTAENKRDTDISWAVSNAQLAQNVEIYYYNNEYKTDTMVYPKGGWTSDIQVYQVAGGETTEFDIPLDVSLVSIQQPSVIDALTDRFYTGPSSVYCIAGNDGAPIPAAQWTAGGGSLRVTINDDKRSLHVVLVGMNDFTGIGPFRVAYSSGEETYSSLRIMGTGVFFDKKKLTLPTGVPESKSAQLVGATVDNPFISTLDDAYKFGSVAAGKWGSAGQTISVNTVGINTLGVSGALTYPTFADFNAAQGSNTFSQFNATQVYTITNVVGDGNFVTFTANNILQAGTVSILMNSQSDVIIAGVNPANYNTGDFGAAVYSATPTQFVIRSGDTATYVSGGTASSTFRQFNRQQFALVQSSFENQAFGNVAGARVKYRDSWYRIRSANITESSVSYSAERDTLVEEFDAVWSGQTFDDFDTQFTGKLFEDFGIIPLWQT
jgi:hypothetical protein